MTPAPQDEMKWLYRSVRSLTGELLTVYEELSLLYSLGPQIGRLGDEDQIAAVALQEAMEILSADCGWVVLWEGGKSRVPTGCQSAIRGETMDHITRVVLEPLYREGKAQFLSHALREDFKLGEADVPARFLASLLPAGGKSRGYLCLGRHQNNRTFTSVDQKLINAVTCLTAVDLENVRLQRSELEKQRLARELELARRIQESLLPRNFACSDFLVATGVSEPCYEIGGDCFDLIPIATDLCLMVIADVSGKGPPAALQAAMVQGVVHAMSRQCQDMPRLMKGLNECILARTVEGHFVTAFSATLDNMGRLRYTNGGHMPPLWIRTNGQVVELSEGGPLLGFFENPRYPEGSVQLRSGDLLLLFTDGVTDAENPQGDTFGMPRLMNWAKHEAGRLPAEAKESLLNTVSQFCGGSRQADDLTVLLVQYSGPSDR